MTPVEFIIGRPILAVPEDNIIICSTVNHQKRWNIIQKITQTYWKQLSLFYSDRNLNNLQQQSKRRKSRKIIWLSAIKSHYLKLVYQEYQVLLRRSGHKSLQELNAKLLLQFDQF